jgi:hypothetical protein
MGLDMYLRGEKYFWSNRRNPEVNRKEDGFKVETITVQLGYWRKHPNLHGFIVSSFADGRDECQPIELDHEDLAKIINAVKQKRLPPTTGFFFGASDNDQRQINEDVTTLERARTWLLESDREPIQTGIPKSIGGGLSVMEVKLTDDADDKQRASRRVIYQASW